MTKQASYLAYAGLIPFILLPLYIASDNLAIFEGVSYFVQYSAIILSFLGGIHWYESIKNERAGHQLYVSMLPSIVGWLSLVLLPPGIALITIGVSHMLMLIYDLSVLMPSKAYAAMRMRITSLVLGSHMMMVWLFYFVI
jgi:hypothetical protein